MRAVCDTCGARYRIPEEKLEGKVLRIRCRKCENVFTVQDTAEASAASAPPPEGEWFFAIGGESFGPYTESELLARFESGRLGGDTFIWKEGFSEWMPVDEHPTFAAAIELSKNSMSRFSSQRPDTQKATEGSGRYTLEMRRPGAILGEDYAANSDAIEDEVNDAFDSLIGSVQNHRNDIDQESATEPMRNLASAAPVQQPIQREPAQPSSTTITSKEIKDDDAGLRATRKSADASKPQAADTTPTDLESETVPVAVGPASDDAPTEATPPVKPAPAKPAAKPAAKPDAKPAAKPVSKPPTRPSSASSAAPGSSNLSLSERLRQIRERSTGTESSTSSLPSPTKNGLPPAKSGLPKPAQPSKPASKPASPVRSEAAATSETSTREEHLTPPAGLTALRSNEIDEDTKLDAPASARTDSDADSTPNDAVKNSAASQSMGSALFSDDEAKELFGDDSEADAVLAALKPSDTPRGPTTEDDQKAKAIAPIPQGPIRQVTQDIDITDLFDDEDDLDPPPVVAPSDEELQQFLDRHQKTRASASDDAKQDEAEQDEAEQDEALAAGVGAAAIGAAAVAPADTHRAEQITPVGGTAAVGLPTASTSGEVIEVPVETVEALQSTQQRQRKTMKTLVIILALLMLGLLLLLLLIPKRGATDTGAPTSTEESVDLNVPAVDPHNVERARNRATSIIAQSQARAAEAAFVATEDERNQRYAANTRGQRSSGSSRSEPEDMGFRLQGSARPSAPATRSAKSSGPSASHFASTLQGAVRTSVGRCAQRARAMDGGLAVSRLELSISIEPDGTVDRINAQRAVRDTTLMNCLRNESMRWRFASFEGSKTTITHPFVIQ